MMQTDIGSSVGMSRAGWLPRNRDQLRVQFS